MQTSKPLSAEAKRRILDAAAGAYLARFVAPVPASRGLLDALLEDAEPEFRNPISEALWWCSFDELSAAVRARHEAKS